jgi:hypothetical protein
MSIRESFERRPMVAKPGDVGACRRVWQRARRLAELVYRRDREPTTQKVFG